MKGFFVIRCLFRLCRNEGTVAIPKAGKRLRCPLCTSLNVKVLKKAEI